MFGGKSDVLREFTRETLRITRTSALQLPSMKRERITLGEAARLGDVDRWTMRDVLREHGADSRLGLADEADAAYESQAANEDQGVTVVGSVGVSLATIDADRIAESAAAEWLSTWIDEIGYHVPFRNVSEHRLLLPRCLTPRAPARSSGERTCRFSAFSFSSEKRESKVAIETR